MSSSQRGPVYPFRHSQWKEPSVFTHFPACSHGLLFAAIDIYLYIRIYFSGHDSLSTISSQAFLVPLPPDKKRRAERTLLSTVRCLLPFLYLRKDSTASCFQIEREISQPYQQVKKSILVCTTAPLLTPMELKMALTEAPNQDQGTQASLKASYPNHLFNLPTHFRAEAFRMLLSPGDSQAFATYLSQTSL